MRIFANALRAAAAAAFALLAASCHSNRDVIPEEALQAPAHARFYTATNLWYETPDAVHAPTVLKGSIIPFGTEIVFLSADQKSLKFKDAETGVQYSLDFDQGLMVMTMEDYLRKTFSTKSSDDVAKDLRPSTYEKLKRGVVEAGMTRDMVLLAYGYPAPSRTSSLKDDTWIYWDDTLKSRRVVFKGDKVVAVFDFD
jgi:hypothetical protein